MRIPYACRPLKATYLAVSKVIADDKYLEMTEGQFIGECMKASGGGVNPLRYKQIYTELMKDAGLAALNSPLKSSPEDNGDHSWEYYVDGKMMHDDEYNNTAHTTYYTA